VKVALFALPALNVPELNDSAYPDPSLRAPGSVDKGGTRPTVIGGEKSGPGSGVFTILRNLPTYQEETDAVLPATGLKDSLVIFRA